MSTYTTKTLATDMGNAHKAAPFDNKDAAIMWAYGQGRGVTLNMAEKAYKITGLKLSGGAPASRKKEALEWLAATYPSSEEWLVKDVMSATRHIVSNFDVKENTAKEYCKQHSENLGVDHPIQTSTIDSDEVIAWVVEHYDDHDDYESLKEALIEEFTARGRSRSNINEYTKGLRMHYAILSR